jgi:hypothetical protein
MDYLLEAQTIANAVTPTTMGKLNTALAYAILAIAEDVRRIADAAQPTP